MVPWAHESPARSTDISTHCSGAQSLLARIRTRLQYFFSEHKLVCTIAFERSVIALPILHEENKGTQFLIFLKITQIEEHVFEPRPFLSSS